jgi:hypothetical protein
MNPKLKEELKSATTLNQVLDMVNKYYDLDKPLGIAGKAVVISGIGGVIRAIRAKEKTT